MKEEIYKLSFDFCHPSLNKSRAIQYLPMTNYKYQMINYESLPSSLIPHPSAFYFILPVVVRANRIFSSGRDTWRQCDEKAFVPPVPNARRSGRQSAARAGLLLRSSSLF